MTQFAPHFCKGSLPVAFVFSVPGAEELAQGRPVSGDTGENLDDALRHLNSDCPNLFPSVLRYDYRVTNAFADPMAVSLGSRTSEAKKSQILTPGNVARVLNDLDACVLVILSGKKPALLLNAIVETGKKAIEVVHVGNKGLNRKFPLSGALDDATSAARRALRVEMWAQSIMEQVRAHTI